MFFAPRSLIKNIIHIVRSVRNIGACFMSIPIIRKAVQCGLKDMLLTYLEKKTHPVPSYGRRMQNTCPLSGYVKLDYGNALSYNIKRLHNKTPEGLKHCCTYYYKDRQAWTQSSHPVLFSLILLSVLYRVQIEIICIQGAS